MKFRFVLQGLRLKMLTIVIRSTGLAERCATVALLSRVFGNRLDDIILTLQKTTSKAIDLTETKKIKITHPHNGPILVASPESDFDQRAWFE